MTFIAAGNGLFQPTQSTLLTTEARGGNLDLGRVMGAQEGLGALSRIIGPIIAAFIWAETVEGVGLVDISYCLQSGWIGCSSWDFDTMGDGTLPQFG